MTKILVAYGTMAGSTAEVAQAVGEQLTLSGLEVQVLPLAEVQDVQAYDGVVVGAPMIMGWHRQARRFIKRHRKALREKPMAIFVTAMRLTRTDEIGAVDGVPVYLDDKLPRPPVVAGKLNFKERYARLPNYLRPILKVSRPARPASIGVFGGRMEYGRLKWWAVLFAMLVVQAPAGDKRNWQAIQDWARQVGEEMKKGGL